MMSKAAFDSSNLLSYLQLKTVLQVLHHHLWYDSLSTYNGVSYMNYTYINLSLWYSTDYTCIFSIQPITSSEVTPTDATTASQDGSQSNAVPSSLAPTPGGGDSSSSSQSEMATTSRDGSQSNAVSSSSVPPPDSMATASQGGSQSNAVSSSSVPPPDSTSSQSEMATISRGGSQSNAVPSSSVPPPDSSSSQSSSVAAGIGGGIAAAVVLLVVVLVVAVVVVLVLRQRRSKSAVDLDEGGNVRSLDNPVYSGEWTWLL